MKCDEWWWRVKRQRKYKGSTRCIVILFKYGSALFECKVVSGGGHEQWNIPPHVAGHWALRRSRPALKLNNSKSLHYANRPGSSRRWQGWAKCVMLVLRLLLTLCPTHQCECSQKRKPRWSIQHKINRTFFSLSFTLDQLVLLRWLWLSRFPPMYLPENFTKGSRIDKEKTESCREGWWQFCARLIDVCAPPPPCQLDPLTASLQISYLDQPLPCGSPPLT